MTTTSTDYDCATANVTVGMTLPNGETVIALRKMGDYHLCEDGDYDYHLWYVVTVREGVNYHDYATRTVAAMPYGWSWSGGEYFHNIYKALEIIGLAKERD